MEWLGPLDGSRVRLLPAGVSGPGLAGGEYRFFTDTLP